MSATPDSTLAGLQCQLAEYKAERDAALAREAATAEILHVINSSPDDPQPVFELIARSAMQLCPSAQRGSVTEHIGGMAHLRAMHGHDAARVEVLRQQWPRPITRDTVHGRVALTGLAVHVRDVEADEGAEGHSRDLARALGSQSLLGVPLQRDGRTIGSIVVSASEPNAFGDAEVALLESFAEQAAIAIGSAETLRELRQRTGELTESLEQQTATADVLKAISRSAFDLDTVLDTLTRSAANLCNASTGAIFLRDGDQFLPRASLGQSPDLGRWRRTNPLRAGRDSTPGRVLLSQAVEQVEDIQADPEINPNTKAFSRNRTSLGVPLLRDGKVEGVFVLGRTRVEPFTARQIELVQTFADQALIAIENARLFNEVQARTKELTESLEQQTATAEVLKVISRSAFDLQSVLQTLIDSAVRLCNARSGVIFLRDDQLFRPQAAAGNAPGLLEYLRQNPYTPSRKTATARAALTGEVQNIADTTQDAEYEQRAVPGVPEARSLLSVPLMREGRVEGVITLNRDAREPFTERQVDLVRTFADQAVIAIENVRLFDAVQQRTRELTESLEQQTATADVLKAISRSAFDLDTVLDTLTRSAASLCNASTGVIYTRDGDEFRRGASFGRRAEVAQWRQSRPVRPGRDSMAARVVLSRAVEQTLDVQADPEIDPSLKAITNNRTSLAVPLLRSDKVEGIFVLGRMRIEAFSERQIELVQTFADQALIAIDKALRLCGAEFGTMNIYDGQSFQHAADRASIASKTDASSPGDE
jgi:GAF domain-containing protein